MHSNLVCMSLDLRSHITTQQDNNRKNDFRLFRVCLTWDPTLALLHVQQRSERTIRLWLPRRRLICAERACFPTGNCAIRAVSDAKCPCRVRVNGGQRLGRSSAAVAAALVVVVIVVAAATLLCRAFSLSHSPEPRASAHLLIIHAHIQAGSGPTVRRCLRLLQLLATAAPQPPL